MAKGWPTEMVPEMATGKRGPPPETPFESLAFLARSENRIDLLTQLSRGGRTRRELHEATGISQPTLGRILGDFEQRRWIVNNHDGSYTLSPLGELLATEVGGVVSVFDTINRCSGFAEHLPFERFGFDLDHLCRATITTPTEGEPLAHMRKFDELAANASTVKLFSNVISCSPADDSAEADRAHLAPIDELVVTGDALGADLVDSQLRDWLYERIEAGALTLYRSDGSAEMILGIFDGTVGIVPIDDGGMPRGLIEADTEPVRSWVTDIFEERKRSATRVTPEAVLSP